MELLPVFLCRARWPENSQTPMDKCWLIEEHSQTFTEGFSCHTVSVIINAFEKKVRIFPSIKFWNLESWNLVMWLLTLVFCVYSARCRGWCVIVAFPGLEFIKRFSCPTQLSTTFQLFIKNWKIMTFLAFKLSDVIFIMLINFKMPTIVGILTYMSMINFMLSWVEHEKSFITSWPSLAHLLLYTEKKEGKWERKN